MEKENDMRKANSETVKHVNNYYDNYSINF